MDRMSDNRRGRGRPSKGERDPGIMCRPPAPVAEIIRARAEALGMYYGEYVSAILSEYVGLSYLLPLPHDIESQEELPMPRTA